MFGVVDSFDDKRMRGKLWTADSKELITFVSTEPFPVGVTVSFDTVTIATNVKRTVNNSPTSILDVKSEAADAARGSFNSAHHNQHGDREAIEAQKSVPVLDCGEIEAQQKNDPPVVPTIIDCGTFGERMDEADRKLRPWND